MITKGRIFISLLLGFLPLSDSLSDTFIDGFSGATSYSYNNSEGSEDWSGTSWVESGDDGGESGGDILVTGNALRLKDDNNSIARVVNLSAYSGGVAELTFSYVESSFDNNNDWVEVHVRNSGGSWNLLDTYQGSSVGSGNSPTYNISSYIASDTEIRFSTSTSNSMGNNDILDIDNVTITVDASGVDSSCSTYMAQATINEVSKESQNSDSDDDFVELRIIDGSINSSVYNNWSIKICENSGDGCSTVNLSSFDSSTFPWLVAKGVGTVGSFIDFSAGTDIVLYDGPNATGDPIDYLTAGGYSANQPSCSFTYDVDAATGSSTRRIRRLPDATGDWDVPSGNSEAPTEGVGNGGSTPATLIAEYRFDEASWSGVSDEVNDNSGNGLDGIAVDGSDTDNSSPDPATPGDPGTCRYGDFSYQAVQVADNNLLDLDSEFTLTAWIRHQPPGFNMLEDIIMTKGDGSSLNYRLAVQTSGTLRFSWTGGSLDSGTDIPDNGDWVHVAASFKNGEQVVYINGVADATGSATDSLSGNGDDLLIGRLSSGFFGRGFVGQIEEVRVYDGVLTAAEVAVVYAETHACMITPVIDHFDIDHNGSAIYCAATAVTVTAEDSSNNSVTSYAGVVTLNTNSSRGDWSLATGAGTLDNGTTNDGVATYTFDTNDNGVAVFSLDHSDTDTTSPLSINISVIDGAVSDDDLEGDLDFSASGFTITGEALINDPPNPIDTVLDIDTQLAGTDFAVYIAAFGQTPSDASCGIIESYQGGHSLTFSISYDDPSSGTITPTVDGNSIASSRVVNFSLGQAEVTMKYKDVGSIGLGVVEGGLTGNSNGFVVQPFVFDIQLVGDHSASDASGVVFAKAGEDFPVTVYVRDAEGDITPNYGNEAAKETVALTHARIAPDPGSDGLMSGLLTAAPLPAIATYTGSFQWSEVGVIQLIASVDGADGNNYLSSGTVSSTLTPVGRFTPAYFELTDFLITNRTDSDTQAGCVSTFTFLGEELTVEFMIEAHELGGSVTTNYDGDFAKLDGSLALGDVSGNDTGAINVMAHLGGTVYSPGDRLSGTGPVILMANGVGTFDFPVSMDRVSAAGGFNAETALVGVEFAINPIDSDGIEGNGALIIDMENFTTDLYFGRVVVEDAFGPEIQPLPMWAHTEFCTAIDTVTTPDNCTAWQDLSRRESPSLDACSKLSIVAPADTSIGAEDYWLGGDNYDAGTDVLFLPFDSVMNRGGGGWRLNYNGAADSYQVLVPALGAGTVNDYHPYLLLQQGQATFGTYRGNDRIIYWREVQN